MSCLGIRLSTSESKVLDGAEFEGLLSDIAEQLPHKNADVQDVYCFEIDAAVVSPTLIPSQKTKTKNKPNCVAFIIWALEAAKISHTS